MVAVRTAVSLSVAAHVFASRVNVRQSLVAESNASESLDSGNVFAPLCKKEFIKHYDFVGNGGGLAAVQLELNEEQALLYAYPAQHWRAELEEPFKKQGSKLMWAAQPDQEGGARPPVAVVNLLGEIKYVERKRGRTGETATGKAMAAPSYLEIHYHDGTVDTLEGGVYYNAQSVKSSVIRSSYTPYDSGAGFDPATGRWEKASGEDFEKIKKSTFKKCNSWKWCMGFQFNPQQKVCEERCFKTFKGSKCKWHCSATLIRYLANPSQPSSEGMVGPTKCPNKNFCTGYEPTPLAQWQSVLYTPRNSERVPVLAKLHALDTRKIASVFKKDSVDVMSMYHVMSTAGPGDVIRGQGKFANAVGRGTGQTGQAATDFTKVESYRKASMIASEKLWSHLRCIPGLKKCGDDVLAPQEDMCPLHTQPDF